MHPSDNPAGHGAQVAVLVGHRPPVEAVVYHDERAIQTDSGFTVLLSDAPHADDLTDDDPRLATVCVHCLIERHPEAGRGLDLARRNGEANRNLETGDWH